MYSFKLCTKKFVFRDPLPSPIRLFSGSGSACCLAKVFCQCVSYQKTYMMAQRRCKLMVILEKVEYMFLQRSFSCSRKFQSALRISSAIFAKWKVLLLLQMFECACYFSEISLPLECVCGTLCIGVYHSCNLEITLGNKDKQAKNSFALVCVHEKSSTHR